MLLKTQRDQTDENGTFLFRRECLLGFLVQPIPGHVAVLRPIARISPHSSKHVDQIHSLILIFKQ